MRYFLLLSLFASLFTSCDDEQDACLNDPDCEYFRCKVNGEEWSTNCERDPLFACSAIDAQYYINSPSLSITAANKLKSESIKLKVRRQKLIVGSNQLSVDSFIPTLFTNGKLEDKCREFPIDTSLTNKLEVFNLDTINFKIEGRFNFTGINDCNEKIKITDGVFRIKYRF